MAFDKQVEDFSATPAADLRTKQYYFVNFTAVENTVDLAGDLEGGYVLQNKPNPAGSVDVPTERLAMYRYLGITRVVASGALAAGTKITSDAAGKAKAVGAGVLSGILLEAAGADGDIVSMLVIPN